ncbi:MAG: purine nucleoside transporter PunC [Weeksellaceae bacterium]|nr:purine nucleoside transporter PunC [Weeksellaceae bacterium]
MLKENKFHFLIYLAFLSIIGFLAIDMYLPAFEIMRNNLNTSKVFISSSLSLYLGGIGIAQLFWGPVSDKFGNPKTILMGLTIFSLSSIGIYLTHNIAVFLVLRVFQAFGVCAATVCWQALVIERFPSSETSKIFASIMPLVALSPAFAPLLGVVILQQFGWRYIFIVLALIAFLLILYTFSLKNYQKIIPKTKGNLSYSSFFKFKDYIGNVLIYAFCSASFFAWLTGAPFFLKEMGYDESAIGWSFVPQTIAFIVGGYSLRLFPDTVKTKKLLPLLLIGYSIFILLLLFIILFTSPTLTTLLIPFCCMALCNGACYPIVVNNALKHFSENAGKASALQNTIQLGCCFLASSLVSVFSKNALLTTGIVMASTIFFVVIGYRMSVLYRRN